MEEKDRVVIPDEEGNEHVFEVMFTFDVDETEKSYLVATPLVEEEEEEEEVELFAFQYVEDQEEPSGFALYPIETDEEWEMVEEMIETLIDEEDTLYVDDEEEQK